MEETRDDKLINLAQRAEYRMSAAAQVCGALAAGWSPKGILTADVADAIARLSANIRASAELIEYLVGSEDEA